MHVCLLIPPQIYESMVGQARAELPNECCGLLAGTFQAGEQPVGQVVERYPLVNALASPTAYESEPASLLRAHKDMRRRGLEVLAVYHSHPTSEPVPSRTDLAQNYWPGLVHLIISLQSEPVEMRGWLLNEQTFRPVNWGHLDTVTDDPLKETIRCQ